MKNINRWIIVGGTLMSMFALVTSCNDDFMDRYPTTSVTEEVFFNNITDLKTYTNSFYNTLSSPIADIGTDNLAHHNSGSAIDEMMR